MRLIQVDPAPGGWKLILEQPNAYTDGTSRQHTVYLTHGDAIGKTKAQIRQRIRAILSTERALRALRQEEME